jgi:hypothetical protein
MYANLDGKNEVEMMAHRVRSLATYFLNQFSNLPLIELLYSFRIGVDSSIGTNVCVLTNSDRKSVV